MGMYTEYVINVNLKRNTPKEVLNVLDFMVNGNDINNEDIPNHHLFETKRWRYMVNQSSEYFMGPPYSIFRKHKLFDEFESFGYQLSIKSDLKNYDDEIEEFVDFINPYIDCYDGDMIGYKRYEEFTEPTILYKVKHHES